MYSLSFSKYLLTYFFRGREDAKKAQEKAEKEAKAAVEKVSQPSLPPSLPPFSSLTSSSLPPSLSLSLPPPFVGEECEAGQEEGQREEAQGPGSQLQDQDRLLQDTGKYRHPPSLRPSLPPSLPPFSLPPFLPHGRSFKNRISGIKGPIRP